MQLAWLVFAHRSPRLAHHNQLVLYRPGFAAEAAGHPVNKICTKSDAYFLTCGILRAIYNPG
jgi:hypothetical protein